MVHGAVCAAIVCAALMAAGPASAALTVSGSGDGSSGCTLRAVITAASAGSGGGCGSTESPTTTINLPAGHYTLTEGQLPIGASANIAIVGADPSDPGATTIDADSKSRVLEVVAGAHATLDGVELTGGATLHGADSTAPAGFGGRGESGGGILNDGTLTLEHVVVTENRTGRGGNGGGGSLGVSGTRTQGGGIGSEGGRGGGIYNEYGASLTIVDSVVSKNRTGDGGNGGNGGAAVQGIGNYAGGAPGGAGGAPGPGGGIYSVGTLTISGSTVTENVIGTGGKGGDGSAGASEDLSLNSGAGTGGIGGNGGDPTVEYSPETGFPRYNLISGGGGIFNGGYLQISASTISRNHSGNGGDGGGAGIGGEEENGGFRDGGYGGAAGSGGLGAGLLNAGEEARLTNVTIAANVGGNGGRGGPGAQGPSLGGGLGGFGGYGGGIWSIGGGTRGFESVILTDVTIAGNLVGERGLGGEDDEFTGTPGLRGLGAGVTTGGAKEVHAVAVYETNTIIAGNGVEAVGDHNCVEPPGEAEEIKELAGKSVGGQDGSCPGTHTEPHLGTLADNGGPTETALPATGSPAIGIVPLASCTVNVDQRGLSRPGAGKAACDAGAVETGGAAGGPTATSTSLSSAANPSTVGAAVTFTATISPSPGGGTVAFSDGASPIAGCGAVAVVGGQASCAETFTGAASHAIVAAFSGTASFEPSTSPTLSQSVQAASGGGGGTGGEGTGGGGGAETPGGGTGGGGNPPAGGSSGGSTGGSGGAGGGGTAGGPGGGATSGQVNVGGAKVKGTTVSMPITCAGAPGSSCLIKVVLTASEGGGKAGSPRVLARAKGAGKVTVGTASAMIAGGATKTVSVSLNGVGNTLLGKSHKLKATLSVTEAGGAKPLFTHAVTFATKG
jgi:Bacterial Ig-like domain (group 3)